jgi:hypothetical protein
VSQRVWEELQPLAAATGCACRTGRVCASQDSALWTALSVDNRITSNNLRCKSAREGQALHAAAAAAACRLVSACAMLDFVVSVVRKVSRARAVMTSPACPGGPENICSNHGQCDENAVCVCQQLYEGSACRIHGCVGQHLTTAERLASWAIAIIAIASFSVFTAAAVFGRKFYVSYRARKRKKRRDQRHRRVGLVRKGIAYQVVAPSEELIERRLQGRGDSVFDLSRIEED